MKAAVVHAFGAPPTWEEFPAPVPQPDELLVSVTAAAVNPLVLTRASGAHYSAGTTLPFVAGVDGVGTTPDGQRVYFTLPRPPYGSLAEQAPVPAKRLVPVPDALPDVTAAAAAIPGMSSWIPLTRLAPVRPGESVLVNGATGAAGRTAVQVARHFGARSVIATGRDPSQLAALASLGADVVLPLGDPWEAFRQRVRGLAGRSQLGVVLDYLWGPSAEAILTALGGPGAPRGSARVRYVSVGSLAGEALSLRSALLRSSGLEIVGTGIGAVRDDETLSGVREFLEAFVPAHFRVETESQPLASVAQHWGRTGGSRRLVFTAP